MYKQAPRAAGRCETIGLRGIAFFLTACAGVAALGQDTHALSELREWADRFAKPTEVLTPKDAQKLQEQIQSWNLPADKLSPEQQTELACVQILAALAAGDAGGAAAKLGDLKDAPSSKEVLRAAWLVAGATGNAELARQTLDKLKEQKAASEEALRKHLARLQHVGERAPGAEVRVADDKTLNLRERDGTPLLLTFLKVAELKTHEKQVQALSELQNTLGPESKVQFAAVGAETAADRAALQKFIHQDIGTGESPLLKALGSKARRVCAHGPVWERACGRRTERAGAGLCGPRRGRGGRGGV